MYQSGFPDARCLFSWSMINDRHLGLDWSTLVRQISHVFISFISSMHQVLEKKKRHFFISLWIYPCPSVRNVHMKLQFDWIWPYGLAGPCVSTAILVNLFHFHSRAQCQKWWQNCLRTFPWRLKFSVNLSHIQSSGNFQMKSKSNDGHCYEIRQIQFKESPTTPPSPIWWKSGRLIIPQSDQR